MKIKKQYYCSNCSEVIISDDAGDGYKFTKGQKIYCKKRKKPAGSLHYHNIEQMEYAILETIRGNGDGRDIRTYGKESLVTFK